MIREYISWIGLFSSTKDGIDLLKSFKIFQILDSFIDPKGSKDHILTLIVFCLDYGRSGSGDARTFLQNCMEKGSKNLIKSCIELLRLLYRSEL